MSTVFSVSGSMSVRRAVPLMSPSLVLMTRAVMVALSPSRMNRGMLGCTISCFLATASPSSIPKQMSVVCAKPIKRHVVRLSGRVNFIVTMPVVSACSCG